MKRTVWLMPIIAILLAGCNSSSLNAESSSAEDSIETTSEISLSEDIAESSLSSEISSEQPSTSATSSSTSSSSSSSSSETISSSVTSTTSIVSSSSITSSGELFPTISVISNAPTYYSSISTTIAGETLKTALKNLINTNVSVSYDWSRFQSADQSLSNSSNVLTIYARVTYPKTATVGSSAQPNQWNREHTFPQSKIGSTAASDNHHIFADDWKTNSIRGNKLFGEVAHITANQVVDSGSRVTANYTTSSYFEPLDAAKGEVARATLYLNTLYGYALNNNFASSELAVLWALNYPVDDWAMTRNNRVYTNQHNRNPYIDNQAYICKVYGNTSTTTAQLCSAYM